MSRKITYGECTIWYCNSPHYSRGLCSRHYHLWLRTGKVINARSEDVPVILKVLEEAKEVMADFIKSAVELDDDAHDVCRICLASAEWEGGERPVVEHRDSCPVKRAQAIIAKTKNDDGEY